MNNYKSVVLKFGGSVISDLTEISKVAQTIKDLSTRYKIKAVVVSAMGKTTNNLENMAHKLAGVTNKRELDALLATGEMQSATLLAICLNDKGCPAQSYNAYQFGIKTDDNYGDAIIQSINAPDINSLSNLPIVAGFQGITNTGNLTTLGREGSDISAVEIAQKTNADFCWFFKDGGGIYNENQNKAHNPTILREISWSEMLALLDKKPNQVLHKRAVLAAEKFKMPLYVSGINDFNNGTFIRALQASKISR